MWKTCCLLTLSLFIVMQATLTRADNPATDDPLKPWRSGVTIREVSPSKDRHTLHAYYVMNPESPDGSRVVYYSSSAANGHLGDVCIVDRKTGKETTVAKNIHTEDAHRGACQQWISNGKRVAFHEAREANWAVCAVDLDTLECRTLALDHQLAFGQPAGDILPIYGKHWNPGPYRDLEFLNVVTGETRVVVKNDDVRKQYGEWLLKQFGDKPVSIFFPVISPDQKRVFFKMACGSGGDNYMTSAASARQGLVVYDLVDKKFLFLREKWGHPAWFPDSNRIMEMGNLWLTSDEAGKVVRVPNLPYMSGCHPSVSPDGKLFVMDGFLGALENEPKQWGIMVCDMRGGAGNYQILHRFQNNRGAKSWRVNHPHPVFSADGRRIYYNVNEGEWTRLHVAEIGG